MFLGQLEEGADAAIAASAFRTLLTTVPTSDDSGSWELPASVRLVHAADPLSSKFVCVDKPLIPRVMTMRRKHEVLFKAALVSMSTSAGRVTHRSLADRDSHQDCPPGHAGTEPACAEQSPSGMPHATGPLTTAAKVGAEPFERHIGGQSCEGPSQETAARRGVRYDLWRIGGFRAIVRSHEVAQSMSMRNSSQSKLGDMLVNQQDAAVIARAKVEYTANEQVWSERTLPHPTVPEGFS